MGKIKVTLIKSTIGALENQKANAAALGLKKIGQSRVHEDTPVIRGMIKKVDFMVKIEES